MNGEATLARAVRDARRDEGISQRELSRRSGLAASQISRIEAGEIKSPSWETTAAIAQALGRQPAYLGFLAKNTSFDEVSSVFHRHPKLDFEVWSSAPSTDEQYERLREVAYEDFVGSPLDWDYLGGDGRIEQIVSFWRGLTEERRELLLRLAQDQLTLSDLDRRRTPVEAEVA